MKKKILTAFCMVIILAVAITISILMLKARSADSPESLLDSIFASKPLDQVTLTFHYPGDEPKNTREILDEIQKQSKTTLNVKLDFVFHNWSKYESDISTILASNEPCDALFLYEGMMQKDSFQSYARKGLLKDITELLPKCALSFYQKLEPIELSSATVDGKLVALPGRFTSFYRPCFIVREDLMQKYKIPDIKNFDDYEVYLKTIKEEDPTLYPLGSYRSSFEYFSAINGYAVLDDTLELVYKWDDKDMKIMAWEQTPEFRESILTVNSWIDKGYLSTDIQIVYPDQSTIINKLFASFIGRQGSSESYNNMLKSSNITDRSYKEYPLYTVEHAQRIAPMLESLVFSEKSHNVERALMFVNWVESSQENYDLLMYGIKGKNYTLEGKKVALPAGLELSEKFYNWTWRNPFVNVDYERLDNSIPEEYMNLYKDDYKNNSEYAPHTGFVLDKSELNSVAADRQYKLYDFEQSLRSGTFQETSIDDYINTANESGVNDMVAQVQLQINKWLSSKK